MKQTWLAKHAMRRWIARALQLVNGRRDGCARFDGDPQSVAILVPHGWGDATLMTPLLRNLRQRFPGVEIHIVAFSDPAVGFFRADPNVTAVYRARHDPLPYAAAVFGRRFDVLFNPKDHVSATFLLHSTLMRARFKVGHDDPFHRGLFDRLITMEYHCNMALKNCALLAALGQPVAPNECRPYLPPMPVTPAVRACAARMEPERSIIGLNISAGAQARYWTDEKWAALASRFPDRRFMVFSAPQDAAARHAVEATGTNILPSPATGNLYEVGLLVARLGLLVTPDTSLVHVASCTNTPVVGLYGNTLKDRSCFGPFMVPHELVASPTPRVADIALEDVVDAVARLTA